MAASPPTSPAVAIAPTDTHTCSHCRKVWNHPLAVCRCEQVRYCDRDCQKKDWHTHKRKCRDKSELGKTFTKMGVKASFVCSLYPDVDDITTDQVVINYVLRDSQLTDGRGESLLDKFSRDTTLKDCVGEADSYVIHAWRYKWKDLVSALSHSDLDPDRYIWLDALCVNQHEGLSETVPDWWYHGVHDVIESCKHVELVLLPWDKPIPVQRAWCVWEIFGARDKTIDQFKVLVTPEERTRFETSLRQGKLVFESFQRVFADVNIEKAESTNATDLKRISREVKRIGSVQVNDLVMLPLKRWLQEMVDGFDKTCLEKKGAWTEQERCNLLSGRGELFHSLGKLELASKCFEESLDARIDCVQGTEATVDVNTALNNLAAVYMDMGKFDKAQKVLDRALKSCNEMYTGSKRNNPQMAMTLGNFGLNLHHLGKLSQARQFYDDACKVDNETKCNDPETAVRLNNSAKLLQDLGDFKTAKKKFEQALPILREANGDDHPSVATLQNNLALLACAMGNMDEAKVQFEQALECLKRTLGPAHPSVAGALNNIAAIYNNQGQPGIAESYFKEALKIQRLALGEEHPDVATTLNNLASVYTSNGDLDQAHELGKEALKIWKASTGPNSPQTKAAKKLWGGDKPNLPQSPMHRLYSSSPKQQPHSPRQTSPLKKSAASRQNPSMSSPLAPQRKLSFSVDSGNSSTSTGSTAPPPPGLPVSSPKNQQQPRKAAVMTASALAHVVSMLNLDQSPAPSPVIVEKKKNSFSLHVADDDVVPAARMQSGDDDDFDFQKLAEDD